MPKIGWEDKVYEDMRKMSVKNWRRKVRQRKE